MEYQDVIIFGRTISIPAYYQRVESLPGDPEGSVSYMVQSENALCLVQLYPISESESLPRKKETLIAGIRQYLGENQGLIKVETAKDYIYSIVKTLKEQGGVQYILTYQVFYPDFVLNIQAFFEETGITGTRDNAVYQYYRSKGLIGTSEDPFKGWTRDPYDESISNGALMNISELEQFDEMFPGFPLSICRELVRTIKA